MADVVLIGDKELLDKLKKIGDGLSDKLKDAVGDAAQVVVDSARGKAPVETGNLKKSIDKEVENSKDNNCFFRVGIGKEAWYGRFAEYGTMYKPARPFLRPAVDENKDDVVKKIREALNDAIEKAI